MDLERLKIDRGASPSGGTGRRRRRGRLGWIVALVVLAAALFLFRRPLLELSDRLRLPAVSTVRVSRSSSLEASAVSGTAANGYVVARHRAALSADTPGRIVEMNVEEGSVVHAGDVVARLYSDEYEAALRRCEADLMAAVRTKGRAEAEAEASRTMVRELGSRVAAAEARLKEAEASRRLASLDFERAAKLAETNVVSQQAVDTARAELERAEARESAARAALAEARATQATGDRNVDVYEAAVTEAEARVKVAEAARDLALATLQKTEVRAPFDGVVVLKDAEVGEVVSPNSLGGNSRGSVVTMVDFDSLEVQVEVPETSLAAVEIGAPANIYLDAFPEKRYRGIVQRIWPTANRQKATVEVRVAFDEPDDLLRPEMGARVVFSPDEAAAQTPTGTGADEKKEGGRILVPNDCIVRVEGIPGVFVLERDVARFRPLVLGPSSSGRTLASSGLEGGELLVSKPPLSLADGDRVRVKE